MKRNEYERIEQYMLACMKDSAHDKDHVYRVLMGAMIIAGTEAVEDMDVLIAACLLHDIGRPDQIADPSLCHAQVGAERAYAFLLQQGWSQEKAERVRHCIRAHRFRKAEPPQSIEAKILYDADKLDVTGAIGVARTLQYNGALGEPICTTTPAGGILDGSDPAEPDSFFREYRYKLEGIYDRFLTRSGAQLAKERRAAAQAFYASLLGEMRRTMDAGNALLDGSLE